MIALYSTATGELVSVGSTVADPLPAGLTALDLGDDNRLLDGTGRWDVPTRSVVTLSPSPAQLEAQRGAERVALRAILDTIDADLTELRSVRDAAITQIAATAPTNVAQAWTRIKDVLALVRRTDAALIDVSQNVKDIAQYLRRDV